MFKDKVVLITGAAGGLGSKTAINFAQEGASGIVIHDLRGDALREVRNQCEKVGGGKIKVHECVGDITAAEVREKLIKETIKEFGRLDILVNNVGICLIEDLGKVPIDVYDKQFDVNVRSVVVLTQLAMPHLIKTGGNIVNVSSVATFLVNPNVAYYCMTKAALDTYTKCLALELGPKGVRANSVNPGVIDGTGIKHSRDPDPAVQAAHTEALGKGCPLRRNGTADDIVDAIIFLASDKASFITGETLRVDGGLQKLSR